MSFVAQIRKWLPIRAFIGDVSGGFAVIFALTLPVMVGGAALALDYSNFQRSRVGVQAALDASALWYAQRVSNSGGSENNKMLQEFFDLNLNSQYEINYESLTSSWGPDSLVVSVDISSPSLFSLGTFTGTVETHVTWADEQLEIALVIDTAGRVLLKGNKTAITDAVSTFLDSFAGKQSKIGVVPFSDTINVGTDFSTSWLDLDGKAQFNGVNISKPGGDGNHFTLFDTLGVNWAGCVEARPSPHDENDTAPSPIDLDSFWVPYFQPSDKNNSYLDLTGADETTIYDPDRNNDVVWDAAAYTSARYTPAGTAGPNTGCNPNAVLDLTSNLGLVRNHIDQLTYEGDSLVHLGILWGWRLLSPAPPFERGKAYTDEKVKKVIVLVTDGINIIPLTEYTSYGYLVDGRLSAKNKAAVSEELDSKILRICKSARDAGIDIFALGIATEDLTKKGAERMKFLLDNCVGEQENSLIASTPEEVATSLSWISKRLAGLRIAR